VLTGLLGGLPIAHSFVSQNPIQVHREHNLSPTLQQTMLFQSVTLSVLLASASALGPASVDLGTAENYAILTKSGISSTGVTSVVGDLGVSPINEAAITGFDLIHDETTHSTSALVTGNVFAADRASPTPSVLTTAVSDMQRPRSVMLSSFEGRRK